MPMSGPLLCVTFLSKAWSEKLFLQGEKVSCNDSAVEPFKATLQ